jgi:predicted DNA-binding WGR domain protein
MVTILGHRPVYWECTIDGHSKFWAAQIIENMVNPDPSSRTNVQKIYTLVRKWGAIGTEGQKMEQDYGDLYEAERALDKLIWDKESKGYKPIF